jgi:hypothetical protein
LIKARFRDPGNGLWCSSRHALGTRLGAGDRRAELAALRVIGHGPGPLGPLLATLGQMPWGCRTGSRGVVATLRVRRVVGAVQLRLLQAKHMSLVGSRDTLAFHRSWR